MSEQYKDSRGEVIPFLRVGRVIDNSDPNGIGVLKIRIDGIDKLDSDDDLIECLPLLPKYLNVFPENGQAVYVIQSEYKLGSKTSDKSKRYWIGPLVSQLQNLENENYKSALTQELDGYTKPDTNIENLPDAKGAYPTKKDIAIQGKDNTDILFKPKEIQIRAGKFDFSDNLKYNKKDPGYIQIKYGSFELKKEFTNKQETRTIQIPPTHVIKANINSFLVDGTPLATNLQPEQYSESKRHLISITVEDVENNNDLVYSFTNNDKVYEQRTEAVKDLKEQVDNQKSAYEKWKIITPVVEIIEHLGEKSQNSKTKQTIMFPNNTRTETVNKVVEKVSKATTNKEGSVVNIVGSKINLISHDGDHTFDLTTPVDLITTDTQKKIHAKPEEGGAHPLVYGDILIEFLELVRGYVKGHTHPEHQMVSVDSEDKTSVLNFDLERILNKNINSN